MYKKLNYNSMIRLYIYNCFIKWFYKIGFIKYLKNFRSQQKYFFMHFIKNFFFPRFYTILNLFNINFVRFDVRLLDAYPLTASYVTAFMVRKLKQGFTLGRIMNELKRSLNFFSSNLTGFRICCVGRFTRRDRATFIWKTTGSVPLNRLVANIDYSVRKTVTINGIVAFKVWLYKK